MTDSTSPTVLTDSEIGDLDVSLARVIADAVHRLRDMDHGYPAGMEHEEWIAILTELEQSFATYNCHECKVPKHGLKLLKRYWQDLWD